MHRSVRLLRPPALVRPSFQVPLAARAIRHVAPALVRSPVLSQVSPIRFYATKDTAKDVKQAAEKAAKGATDAVKNAAEEAMNSTSGAVSEIKGVAQSVADMISGKSGMPEPVQQVNKAAATAMAGMEVSSHSHGGSASEDFASITKTMVTAVPKPVLYFGLAGTLPYLATSVGIIGLAREAHRASLGQSTFTGLDLHSALENLHTLEHIQITYGAIILSFLGALHWGMEFAKLGGAHGYSRLTIGTLPVLFAWPTTFLTHGVALAVQWAGFTGMWLLDQRASTNGWTTSWYSTYRFYLSIIVGFSIIATFVGTGYYGAGAGATTDLKKHRKHGHAGDEPKSTSESLDQKKEKKKGAGRVAGKVAGAVAVEENEGGEGYGKVHNVEKEEEKEAEEKAEDDKKSSETQNKKDDQKDKAGSTKDDAKEGKKANEQGGKEEKEGGEEGGEEGEQDKEASDKGDKKEGDGRSQEKKDDPKKKDAAGEKGNTGKR